MHDTGPPISPTVLGRITILPDVCNGRPTIRGLRITVATVLGYLAAGETIDEVLRQHPKLEREDVLACLEFATQLMDRRYEIKPLVA